VDSITETFQKNVGFDLRYTDPLGFGLLHNRSTDESLFLNPVATSIWKANCHRVDPNREQARFVAETEIPGMSEYVARVIEDLHSSGALLENTVDLHANVQVSSEGLEALPSLSQIYFYTTKRCNARCYHCYQPTQHSGLNSRQEQWPELTAHEFLALTDNAVSLGLKHVKLTGGEPLLRKDWTELVEGLCRRQISVSIETNAYFLDESAATALADYGVDVSISLDGSSAQAHDKYRNLAGSFERVINAISLLSEKGVDPKVIMSVSRLNINDIEGVVHLVREHGCRLIKINPVSTLGIANRLAADKALLNIEQIQDLYQKRTALESKYDVFLYLEGPPAFGTIGDILTGHAAACPFTHILGVLSDGSLSFCGVGNSNPELVFGNVRDENFDINRVWKASAELGHTRKVVAQPLSGVCGSCLLSEFCKGSCRALAYAEYGSFEAPHPWCQHAHEVGRFPIYYLRP